MLEGNKPGLISSHKFKCYQLYHLYLQYPESSSHTVNNNITHCCHNFSSSCEHVSSLSLSISTFSTLHIKNPRSLWVLDRVSWALQSSRWKLWGRPSTTSRRPFRWSAGGGRLGGLRSRRWNCKLFRGVTHGDARLKIGMSNKTGIYVYDIHLKCTMLMPKSSMLLCQGGYVLTSSSVGGVQFNHFEWNISRIHLRLLSHTTSTILAPQLPGTQSLSWMVGMNLCILPLGFLVKPLLHPIPRQIEESAPNAPREAVQLRRDGYGTKWK